MSTAIAANPAGPFPCDSCGHALNLHDPCTASKGKGICTCRAFSPADLKVRVARLTDVTDEATLVANLAQMFKEAKS